MKEILLQNTGKGLMAHFLVNGKPEKDMVEVMGTHIIPTPFIPGCDTMPEVVKEIRRRNPGYRVSSI